MSDFITDSDILKCRNVDIKTTEDGDMVYTCRVCGIPCEDVMRCSDGCELQFKEVTE